MGYPSLGSWFEGFLFGVAGFGNFVGKIFSVPAQGDGVHLHSGGYLHGYGFSSLIHGKLQCCKESFMAISYLVCHQDAFFK